jgi:Relaxase/Mobilisation nuclease domain
MIIRGTPRAGPIRLGATLSRIDENDHVAIDELRGVCARTLTEALREMHAHGAGSKAFLTLYHALIRVRATDPMTPERWKRAVDELEAELGLIGQPRAVVRHVKQGNAHTHVVWSRIDVKRSQAIGHSHNYRSHERVARRLELEFGHARTQGVHTPGLPDDVDQEIL